MELFLSILMVFLLPALVFGSARSFRWLLEYLDRPRPRYPSLDVAIVEVAFLVLEGRLSPDDIDSHLYGFSLQQRCQAFSILSRTKLLTDLDVEFEDIEEQMLFSHVLAFAVSSIHSRLVNME